MRYLRALFLCLAALSVATEPVFAQAIVARPASVRVAPLRTFQSAVAPVGATWVWVGDGIVAAGGGAGSGTPNAPHQFARLIGGRLQPGPLPIIARSGSTIGRDDASNRAWINPYAIDAAIAQRPNFLILGSMGANDNLLSTDPGANPASGATTNVFLQDWYNAVNYARTQWAAYAGPNDVLCIVGTFPSAKTGETTIDAGQSLNRRTRVWNAQAAHVAALAATDSRIVFASMAAYTDPTALSIDGPGNLYVHPDERGGYAIASAVFSAIDAKVATATADQISDMIAAGTYPLMTAANLDTDGALVGTAGTITGPGVTGTIATSKAITNTTGATGITVAQVSTSGGRTKTLITLAGTTTAAGRVQVRDKSNLSVSATPGQYVKVGAIFRGTAFRNFGGDWGNFGTWGGGASALTNNARAGADETRAMDNLVHFNPQPVFGSSGPFATTRGWALSYASGVTLAGRTIEIERPFAYVPSNRTARAPAYIGDLADSSGSFYLTTNYRMRPTGTVTQAAGGTVRFETGTWNLFGLTEADFTARRAYCGGTAGQAGIGTGTLLATVSGSTWTAAISAGACATGSIIYEEIDANNGVGGTVTARSVIGITVG